MAEAIRKFDFTNQYRVLPHQKLSMFPTIRETARLTGLSDYSLRKAVKEGTIPFIMCGNRVRINYAMLIEQINRQSAERICSEK